MRMTMCRDLGVNEGRLKRLRRRKDSLAMKKIAKMTISLNRGGEGALKNLGNQKISQSQKKRVTLFFMNIHTKLFPL